MSHLEPELEPAEPEPEPEPAAPEPEPAELQSQQIGSRGVRIQPVKRTPATVQCCLCGAPMAANPLGEWPSNLFILRLLLLLLVLLLLLLLVLLLASGPSNHLLLRLLFLLLAPLLLRLLVPILPLLLPLLPNHFATHHHRPPLAPVYWLPQLMHTRAAAGKCPPCIAVSAGDAAAFLPATAEVQCCRDCGRYCQPPQKWVYCDWESKQLLTLCLKRLRGLSRLKLVDAGFVWTEPHSKRIQLKLTTQQEVFAGTVLEQQRLVTFTVVNLQASPCFLRPHSPTPQQPPPTRNF